MTYYNDADARCCAWAHHVIGEASWAWPAIVITCIVVGIIGVFQAVISIFQM